MVRFEYAHNESLEVSRSVLRAQVEKFRGVLLECCDSVTARQEQRGNICQQLQALSAGLINLSDSCTKTSDAKTLKDYQSHNLKREAQGLRQLSANAETYQHRVQSDGMTVESCQALVGWLLNYQQVDEESTEE